MAKCVSSSPSTLGSLSLPRPAVPNVLWAQRKEFVLLKIDLPDVKNEKIEVNGSKLTFNGEAQGKQYAIELDLHADVVKEVREDAPRDARPPHAHALAGQQVDRASPPD
jgi:hypothetical protein